MHRSEYENTPNGGSKVRTWIAPQRELLFFFPERSSVLGMFACLWSFYSRVFVVGHVCAWLSHNVKLGIMLFSCGLLRLYSGFVYILFHRMDTHSLLPAPSVVSLCFRVLNKCLDCTLRVAEGWRLHSGLSIRPSVEGKGCLGLSNPASIWWNVIRRFVKEVLWIMALFKSSAFLWRCLVFTAHYIPVLRQSTHNICFGQALSFL